MKRRIVLAAGACLLAIVALLLIGLVTHEPERVQSTYTVRPGDKLYTIAADMGIRNWRKWAYEVCALNGIEDYMIYPGDCIIIFTED